MNFNLKLKKIRTFRKMTQKELSEKIGLTDQHRIVQYEKGVRVPKKDLVDKMAQALDVNPYTCLLYTSLLSSGSDVPNHTPASLDFPALVLTLWEAQLEAVEN